MTRAGGRAHAVALAAGASPVLRAIPMHSSFFFNLGIALLSCCNVSSDNYKYITRGGASNELITFNTLIT